MNETRTVTAHTIRSAAGIVYTAKRLTNGVATWWSIIDDRGQNVTCTVIGQKIQRALAA